VENQIEAGACGDRGDLERPAPDQKNTRRRVHERNHELHGATGTVEIKGPEFLEEAFRVCRPFRNEHPLNPGSDEKRGGFFSPQGQFRMTQNGRKGRLAVRVLHTATEWEGALAKSRKKGRICP